MIPDAFERGPLPNARLRAWKSKAQDAVKAWQKVDALTSELVLELAKFEAEYRAGRKLVTKPDPSGKPGRYVAEWVNKDEDPT